MEARQISRNLAIRQAANQRSCAPLYVRDGQPLPWFQLNGRDIASRGVDHVVGNGGLIVSHRLSAPFNFAVIVIAVLPAGAYPVRLVRPPPAPPRPRAGKPPS